MTHYVFCFPYRGVGGVPVLFLRLAQRLVKSGHRASVVDYPNGAMAQALDGTGIELIAYDEAPASVVIPDDCILVLQSLNPWAMYAGLLIPDSARLFFWNCHPFNLVPVFPGLRGMMMSNPALGRFFLATVLRRYRRIIHGFIRFLLGHHALAFMDKTNADNTADYLRMDLPQPDYLPIPAAEVCDRYTIAPRDWARDGIRLAWIGRIADFKYPILRHTLQELGRMAPMLGVPLHFTVVGGGEHVEDLSRDIAALRNLDVTLRGEIALAEVETFLRNEVDILMAMGTSALEGARLGVPTILLDVSYGTIPPGYVFRWLHERTGYTLGEMVQSLKPQPGNHSLADRLKEAMDNGDALSRAAHEYYRASHAPEAVMAKFIRMTSLSDCFYRDFKNSGFSARDPLYERFAKLRKRFV